MAGIVGASGLKLLACLWFAVGLGTVTLLPSAEARARAVVFATPQPAVPESAPRPDLTNASVAPRAPQRRARPAEPRQLSSPHATPMVPAVGVASTVERPRTVRRPTTRATVPVRTEVAPVSAAAEAAPPLVSGTPELPVVGPVSVTPPPLPVAVPDVPELPRVEVPELP